MFAFAVVYPYRWVGIAGFVVLVYRGSSGVNCQVSAFIPSGAPGSGTW